MAIDVLLLCLGLALLLGGGHLLVNGAERLAGSLGVSELAIGLTVVAFGTSAPELAVNTLAALRDDPGLAFGNVVGSNLANLGLVLGLSALLRPLRIESAIVSREIPIMLLATAVALVLGLDRLRGTPESYSRADGAVLLLLFAAFLYDSIRRVLAEREDPLATDTGSVPLPQRQTPLRGVALALLGLALLIVGARVTITYAVSLAEDLGVPAALVGLSVVALGTSLPELATSLAAAQRGLVSLAVGNVVGSNVFNLLFILGTTATIHPVPLPVPGGGIDLLALALFSGLLLAFGRAQGATIGRAAGVVLVAAYVVFIVWRFAIS